MQGHDLDMLARVVIQHTCKTRKLNAWIEAYGAANNIPVINYADALCGCVGSVGASLGVTGYFYGTTANPSGTYLPLLAPTTYYDAMTPTAAGYALMTQLAQNTIATVSGVTLKSGTSRISTYRPTVMAGSASRFQRTKTTP